MGAGKTAARERIRRLGTPRRWGAAAVPDSATERATKGTSEPSDTRRLTCFREQQSGSSGVNDRRFHRLGHRWGFNSLDLNQPDLRRPSAKLRTNHIRFVERLGRRRRITGNIRADCPTPGSRGSYRAVPLPAGALPGAEAWAQPSGNPDTVQSAASCAGSRKRPARRTSERHAGRSLGAAPAFPHALTHSGAIDVQGSGVRVTAGSTVSKVALSSQEIRAASRLLSASRLNAAGNS